MLPNNVFCRDDNVPKLGALMDTDFSESTLTIDYIRRVFSQILTTLQEKEDRIAELEKLLAQVLDEEEKAEEPDVFAFLNDEKTSNSGG